MAQRRLELRIGTSVEAADGPLGHVHRAILGAAPYRVSALLVRSDLVPRHDLIVPAELIGDATDARVLLRIERDYILRQPAVNPARYLTEAQRHENDEALESITGSADERPPVMVVERDASTTTLREKVGDGALPIRQDVQVWATDGRAGSLKALLLDDRGRLRHLVVRKGQLLSSEVIVPVDWISAIDENRIWLVKEREALDRLPPYRADDEILEDVRKALRADDVIRAVDIDTIDVAVHDGVVTLSGYASTMAIKSRAERAALQAPGVLDVTNCIVTDDDVVAAVAEALAENPRTRRARIAVHARHGFVTLRGEVPSARVRAAAEEIAASVPEVRGVVNSIRAPGVVVDETQQRLLQPQVGREVYATDMRVGRVERVIISPRHRRVTAIVVHGKFPDPQHAEKPLYEMPLQERTVVIPIEVVDDVTIGGVQLAVSAVDAARSPDFHPDDYVGPAQDWKPPYPYSHADVLLDLGRPPAPPAYRVADEGDVFAVEPGPEGEAIRQRIRRGMPVLFLEGIVGTVDHVLVDPQRGDVVTHIVVRAGGPLTKDTVIPVDWIRRIEDSGILVEVAAEQLAALPRATTER